MNAKDVTKLREISKASAAEVKRVLESLSRDPCGTIGEREDMRDTLMDVLVLLSDADVCDRMAGLINSPSRKK
jgi:hypothetical protein